MRYTFISILLLLFACTTDEIPEIKIPLTVIELQRGTTFSEIEGKQVFVNTSLQNNDTAVAVIQNISITIRSISNPSGSFSEVNTIEENINLQPGEEYIIENLKATEISSGMQPGAYGLYVEYTFSNHVFTKTMSHYLSYFRVHSTGQLSVYQIEKENYKGLDVFQLQGGMSAEYAVQKSLSVLSSGVSHTWTFDNNAGGPEPVYGNPDFLVQSVKRTVDLYNAELGANTPVKTLIISTGIVNVPYLANAMKAPVLPLHFLVSVNTAKELRSILDYSLANNHQAYATLGYDGSMPGVGVAWVKLLDLPAEYQKFIKDHQVENIILMGVGQAGIGESYARKVKDNNTVDYAPGTMYILYPGYGSQEDINALNERIIDFASLSLEKAKFISDWESGISNIQINNFSSSLKNSLGLDVYSIAPNDMMVLYNSSTYFTLELMKKNKAVLGNNPLKGVVLNEYLISHPAYEINKGYVSLLYWQFASQSSTIDRVEGHVQNAIKSYFPESNFAELNFLLNSNYGRQNLKQELEKRGLNNITENTDPGDLWNPSDGFNKRCEKIADEITTLSSPQDFKNWNNSLIPLNINDLQNISEKYPEFKMIKR